MKKKNENGDIRLIDANKALDDYSDMVYRIALLHMKNKSDAEDIFQEVFLRLVRYADRIKGEEHLKHWLIRMTINCCKKQFDNAYRKRTVPLEADGRKEPSYEMPERDDSIWEAVRQLPDNYSSVIHLFYYEQYSIKEIGQIMELSDTAVKTRLSRARDMLRDYLEGGQGCAGSR